MNVSPKGRIRAYIDHRVLQQMQQQTQELAALRARVDELNHFVRRGEDSAFTRDAIGGILDRLASVSTDVGLQVTRTDERLARIEVAVADRAAARANT
jgi:hypothetical protein